MTGCSKPLDFVKNKIFFFGDVGAAYPDARTSARRHHETVGFLDMARQPNTQLWCEKKIMPPFASSQGAFKNGAGTVPGFLSTACRFSGTSRPRQPSPPLLAQLLERALVSSGSRASKI